MQPSEVDFNWCNPVKYLAVQAEKPSTLRIFPLVHVSYFLLVLPSQKNPLTQRNPTKENAREVDHGGQKPNEAGENPPLLDHPINHSKPLICRQRMPEENPQTHLPKHPLKLSPRINPHLFSLFLPLRRRSLSSGELPLSSSQSPP